MSRVTLSSCYDSLGQRVLGHELHLGDAVLLLDAGWTAECRREDLAELEQAMSRADAVLLSSSSLSSLGALPALWAQRARDVPVLLTSASHKMGQMEVYEQQLALSSRTDFAGYDLNDVDAAFDAATTVNYLERVGLDLKGELLHATAHPAGHRVGAAIWCIQWRHEQILFAPAFNHRRDRHLPSAHLGAIAPRPLLVVGTVDRALQTPAPPAQQDAEFLNEVQGVLRAGGSVLVPVDTAGRVFELLLLLDRHWAQRRLPYPLVWLSSMAASTREFAKSSTEWVLESLVWQGPHMRPNPFSLPAVTLCASAQDLERLPPGPRVVLASGADLGQGLAREELERLASDPASAVVLVAGACGPGAGVKGEEEAQGADQEPATLAERLAATPQGATLAFTVSARVPLEGQELEAALQEEQEARSKPAEADAAMVEEEPVPVITRIDTETICQASAELRLDRAASAALSRSRAPEGGEADARAALPAGAPSVDCLVDGFQVPEGASGPLFPFPAAPLERDAYGTVEDIALEDDLASKAGAYTPPTDEAGQQPAAEEREEAAVEEERVPTKVVERTVELTLAARVLRFNFAGLVDGRSVRLILNQSAPRTCVLVSEQAANVAAVQELQAQLARDLAPLRSTILLGPKPGEHLEISTDPVLSLETDEALVSSLDVHSVGANRLAWISGRLEEGEPRRLQPAQSADAGAQSGAGIFIGDVKLSEIRAALQRAQIASEFSGGALYCEGPLVIRRSADEQTGLTLEGPLSDQFYRVQDIIYSQYHIC